MQTGYRIRCYPSPEQEQILLRWLGCQRFIYNAKVREDRYFRAFQRKSLALAGQYPPVDQQYSQFISEDTNWLREVPSQVLRNGAVRWKQAYGRYFSNLANRPTLHKKTGKQSVWLTSELFRFEPSSDGTFRLLLGTKKFPVGDLVFHAHREFSKAPASITLSLDAGRWFLSFNLDDERIEPAEADTVDWLRQFSEEELMQHTIGLDRGVVIPLCTSTGRDFDLQPIERERIAKKRRAAKRWQKRLSRRTKGSSGWRKAKRRIAMLRRYEKDVRWNFAHQASHHMVDDPKILLYVFEALGVQRMTKRPKPKQDEQGHWLPNRASSKAGLNQVILDSAWGLVHQYAQYKARRVGKLAIDVHPHHSSQECACCGHIHPDNRISQSEFVCQCCGHQDNADRNAAKVIKRRGVALIVSGEWKPKNKKRAMRFKKTVGAERSESKPVETTVRPVRGNTSGHESMKPETPATTASAV